MLPVVEVSQSPEDKFREYLASGPRPQRLTGPRREIVSYIFKKHNHFHADQLLDEMKAEGLHVTRATLYRTLKKLVAAGLLRELDLDIRKFYEHDYGYAQHDHLYCQKCHKVIEFQHPAMEEMIRAVCGEHQFQIQGHSLVVRGTCADCNRARVTKRRLDLV